MAQRLQCVDPVGVDLQAVETQLTVPTVLPFMMPNEVPFDENVCCQASVQFPPFMHVCEQLRM